MKDAIVDPAGGWRSVAYGSTPNSLASALTIAPESFDYVPSDETQTFSATLTLDPSEAQQPLFGNLAVAVLPPDAGPGTISVVGAIELQVLAAPSAEDIARLPGVNLSLSIERISVSQDGPWSSIDAALPDIPRVIGHGPATAYVDVRNTGTVVLDTSLTVIYRRISPLAALTGSDGSGDEFTINMAPRFLLADGIAAYDVQSLIPVQGAPAIDALPFIGFVKVIVRTSGDIAGLPAPTVTKSQVVLVFPWSEALFLFVVWLFQREWRHRRGRSVNQDASPPAPTLRTRVRELLRRVWSVGRARGPAEGDGAGEE